MAHDFPQTPPHDLRGREIEQAHGALVGEEDALAGVQGDDAFEHAAQDGPQLFAVLFQLSDADGKAFGHAVEGVAQLADLVLGIGVDPTIVRALGDAFRRAGHVAQRENDAPGDAAADERAAASAAARAVPPRTPNSHQRTPGSSTHHATATAGNPATTMSRSRIGGNSRQKNMVDCFVYLLPGVVS